GRLAAVRALDVAATDHAQGRHLADADGLRRGVECDLAALGLFAVAVHRDVVVVTEAANTLLGPAIAVARRLAAAIEEACNLPVRHQPGQLANEGYRILKHRPMLPASRIQSQLELQRSVVPALPVQDQVDDRVLPSSRRSR